MLVTAGPGEPPSQELRSGCPALPDEATHLPLQTLWARPPVLGAACPHLWILVVVAECPVTMGGSDQLLGLVPSWTYLCPKTGLSDSKVSEQVSGCLGTEPGTQRCQ